MKKVKILIAAVLALLSVTVCALLVSAAPDTVYVSSTGSDTNNGESKDTAVQTFGRAFELMPSGGKIVLCGSSYKVDKDFSMPASDGKYTLTSEMSGAFAYSGALELNSDFVIENIKLSGSSTPMIVCNGHNVKFGKGIVNATNSYIVGGANLVEGDSAEKGNFSEDYTIEINSGRWVSFFGGNRRASGTSPTSTISANITVIVDGATMKKTGALGTENHCNISGMNGTTGDLTLEIKSGEIWGSIYAIGRLGTGASKSVYSGNISIKISGGTFENLATDSNKSKGNGLIDVCQDNNSVYNGNFKLSISDAAQISLTDIKASGVEGNATLDVPASIIGICSGFRRDVYVAGSAGSDNNSGTSTTDAYATLEKAVSVIAESGGSVIVCADTEMSTDAVLAASEKDILITSVHKNENYKNSAKLTIKSAVQISSNVTFDNITVNGEGTLYAGGHTLTMSSTVETDGKLNISASAVNGESSSGGQAVLEGGAYNVASAGSVNGKGAASVTNTIVSVEGAQVKVLTVSGGNDISGSSVVSILSGKVVEGIYGIYGTDTAKVSGTASVEIAGGTISGKVNALADGVSSTAPGTYSLTLIGGDVSAVEKISGAGFATSVGKAKEEILSKLENFGTLTQEIVIYVKDEGAGSKDGSTPDNAVASIGDAIGLLAGKDGTVVICGKATVGEFTEPAHKESRIKITSRYAGVDYRRSAGAKLVLDSKYTAGGEVSFDDIVISVDGSTKIFFADGNSMSFGEGVSCIIEGDGGSYPYIFGGSNGVGYTLDSACVTVSGGTWQRVVGGNRNASSYVRGDIKVQINGGNIIEYVAGSGNGSIKGNITMEINGGSFGYGVFAISCSVEDYTTVEGDIDVYINGGTINGKINASRYDEYCGFTGTYMVYLNGGSYDSVTDIKGAAGISGDSVSERVYGAGVSYSDDVIGTIEIDNPICAGADPWVIYHEGYYYMALVDGASVVISKAMNLAELGKAEAVAVWTPTEATGLSNSIWSPELHYFSEEDFGAEHAGWYLYVACLPYGSNSDTDGGLRRCYALKALTDDPQGAYGSPVDGERDMAVQIQMDADNSNWNIGPSIIRINGIIYMTWTGREFEEGVVHRQNLSIAELANPYSIKLDTAAAICWPTETWEKYGATYGPGTLYPEVVEGATAVYGKNGEIYIVYSASGYWTDNYALAQLKYLGGDPTDINNWEKCASPIFSQNNNVFGPGHASYVQSPDGTTNYFVYHGYQTSGKIGGRYVYIEEYTVDESGVHLGTGKPADPNVTITANKNPLALAFKVSNFGQSAKNDSSAGADTGASTSADTTANADNDGGSMNTTVVIVVCIAVALAVAVAVVAVVIKKKKKSVEPATDGKTEEKVADTNDKN